MNNEVFNEFLRMNPYVDGHVKKWYPVDDDSIIVESDDGCYKYDSILHTTRYSRNVSKLLSFNAVTLLFPTKVLPLDCTYNSCKLPSLYDVENGTIKCEVTPTSLSVPAFSTIWSPFLSNTPIIE